MTRILTAAFATASLLLLSAPPAASFDFGNPFGFQRSPDAPPRARTVTPRPPAQVEITGSISASGDVDDTVRFIAGLAPPANSPIAPLTRDDSWQHHARYFDRAFGEL